MPLRLERRNHPDALIPDGNHNPQNSSLMRLPDLLIKRRSWYLCYPAFSVALDPLGISLIWISEGTQSPMFSACSNVATL